ncbi:hypothetical protein ACIQU6_30610 [Streptomyces sp. NPDC090442]|uniref:hypothetical protein n=1 Tax=Streptomyces sp. NPDC090442 TaxID=3365962 RepID=UPI003813CE9A
MTAHTPDGPDPNRQCVYLCTLGRPRHRNASPDALLDGVTRYITSLGLRPVGTPAYDVRRAADLDDLESGMLLAGYRPLRRLVLHVLWRYVYVARAWQRSAPVAT